MTAVEAPPDLTMLTIAETAALIRSSQMTASELTAACLDRIATYEPKLNTLITLAGEQALMEAETLDAEQRAGRLRGPLHGIPITLKDSIDTANLRTTGGSAVFKGRVPAEDAILVTRLRAAGAIILGKNNLNEFCIGNGQSSYFDRVRNPWELSHETGGSSSGSCAGVAAGLYPGAIGTDTGGSIRNPASWCGVVGFKPTNGLVPNRGTIPATPSLDVCGPIARSVEDTAIILNVIAGYDELDITSVEHATDDYVAALRQPVAGFRVGLPIGYFDMIEPEIATTIWAAIDTIKSLVHSVREKALPEGGAAMSLMPFGETYAWHEPHLKASRFLYSAKDQATLDALAGKKAEDYIRAKWALDLARRTVNRDLADIDVLVFPTVHTMASKLMTQTQPAKDPARGKDALYDAGLFNVLGLPALSLPCGFGKSGLPIGLCIAGPRFSEGRILALAHAYEQATAWHTRRPSLSPEMDVPPIPTQV
jgi:aspartyl-tRNA(Asn)/glutamyl-tRNA(Gln) amidotransferase subunit A